MKEVKLTTLMNSLRTQNRILNIKEYDENKIFLKSKPRILFIELTRNCNLKCWMCRSETKWDKDLDMDFDLFRKIADELFPFAEIVDLRGWGESTILPWFKEAVEYSSKFRSQLKIYTNLTKRDPDLWKSLVEHDFLIAVSFDGATKKTFETLRRGSRFENVLDNLGLITEHSKKLNKPLERIYLSTVVQGSNLSELPDIVRTAHQYGLSLVKFFPIKCAVHLEENLQHHIDRVTNILDEVAKLGRELGVMVEIGASMHESLTVKQAVPGRCLHPWTYCYISPNGQVGFCDHLIGKDEYTLGNLKESAFMDIWNNSEFQTLRQQHCNAREDLTDRFSKCRWCYENRYTDIEHYLHPDSERSKVDLQHLPLYKRS